MIGNDMPTYDSLCGSVKSSIKLEVQSVSQRRQEDHQMPDNTSTKFSAKICSRDRQTHTHIHACHNTVLNTIQ